MANAVADADDQRKVSCIRPQRRQATAPQLAYKSAEERSQEGSGGKREDAHDQTDPHRQHLKCGHTNWLVIADSLPGLSWLFHGIFLSWSRKCEFTCDRGGALACRDPQAMVRALAKVAVGRVLFEKMNLDALWDQSQELDEDALSRVAEFLQDHPAIARRARALAGFAESSEYARLVSR